MIVEVAVVREGGKHFCDLAKLHKQLLTLSVACNCAKLQTTAFNSLASFCKCRQLRTLGADPRACIEQLARGLEVVVLWQLRKVTKRKQAREFKVVFGSILQRSGSLYLHRFIVVQRLATSLYS